MNTLYFSISVPEANMSTKEPAKKKLKTTDDFSSFHVENSHFERLPNEILLKIVDYLQVRDLLRCGQTCRNIRTVVHDESLWKKVNFSSNSLVPTGLLQCTVVRRAFLIIFNFVSSGKEYAFEHYKIHEKQ